MSQLDLFQHRPEPKAKARRTDPATSHEAAAKMNQGGAAYQRERVCDLVYQHPGATAHELAELSDLDSVQISRRLPEIEEVEPRRQRGCCCPKCLNGRPAKMQTWWPRGG